MIEQLSCLGSGVGVMPTMGPHGHQIAQPISHQVGGYSQQPIGHNMFGTVVHSNNSASMTAVNPHAMAHANAHTQALQQQQQLGYGQQQPVYGNQQGGGAGPPVYKQPPVYAPPADSEQPTEWKVNYILPLSHAAQPLTPSSPPRLSLSHPPLLPS